MISRSLFRGEIEQDADQATTTLSVRYLKTMEIFPGGKQIKDASYLDRRLLPAGRLLWKDGEKGKLFYLIKGRPA